MADTKTLFTQHFDAARAAWTAGDEPAAAESLHWAIIAARGDSSLRRELASALFNLGKLSRKLGRVGESKAGPLLTEALGIIEELCGSQDAALGPVLLELSRLHLQQSEHARAEDALARLLAIARVKVEEHPDVAAALADLAFVKRKLGDDASAEALYRDALRIREKVLEPNDTVTVGTLERLSETCAARGNFAEALALLHRALPTREAALGADHERVRAARSRVAHLELQMAAAAAAARATTEAQPTPAPLERVADSPIDTPSTQARSPINSKELDFLGESVPSISVTHHDVVLADVVLADVVLADVAPSDAVLGERGFTVAPVQADSPEVARKKRTALYSSAGVAAGVIFIAGLLMLHPRAGSGKEPASTETSAAQRTTAVGAPIVRTPAMRTVSNGPVGTAMVAATHADSVRAASVPSARTAAAVQREQRASEAAPAELRAPRVEVHLDSINIPSLSAAPTGDAILRSAMERQRASDSDRAVTRDEVARPTSSDVENTHTSPKIIGRPSEPAFPAALLRSGTREGQVVVRFMVNELGRIDLPTVIVEQSDNELFTAAVRDILPTFRFEPAHTLGLESKPVAAWVSVPFRFTTKHKS